MNLQRLLQKYGSIILVIVLSFFTVQPLFSPGFFKVHDDTQVARVFEMKTALADGMFPVRWVPDLGYNYGYPIFNFYGPFAYYFGGFFNLVGFDSVVATKLMIGLGTLIAGIFMYLLAKEWWGKTGGIISALLYMYAPYHALNIYVRGAIGELWAYGILPLVVFALVRIFQTLEQNKKTKHLPKVTLWLWVSIASLSFAAIIVSHNLTAMMVTPFLFGFTMLLYGITRITTKSYLSLFIPLSFLLGILLAAFYWLPVMEEMQYTNVLSVVGGGSDYHDHFVCLTQLWESPWGFAGSGPGCLDGMSFKLGKAHVLFALLALVPLFIFRKKKKIVSAILLGASTALIAVFLTIEPSTYVWDVLPQMAFFQFPWRFLSMSMFALSFLGGAIFLVLEKRPVVKTIAAAGAIVVILLLNAKLFVPDKLDNRTPHEYTTKSEISWRVSKISDEYMPKGFIKPKSPKEVPIKKLADNSAISVSSYSETTQLIRAEVLAKKKTEVLVHLAYFPGWHVYLDNQQQEFKYFSKGLLVNIPQGKHTVEIRYSQTPVQIAGNTITLTGVFILLAGIILSRKAKKRG